MKKPEFSDNEKKDILRLSARVEYKDIAEKYHTTKYYILEAIKESGMGIREVQIAKKYDRSHSINSLCQSYNMRKDKIYGIIGLFEVEKRNDDYMPYEKAGLAKKTYLKTLSVDKTASMIKESGSIARKLLESQNIHPGKYKNLPKDKIGKYCLENPNADIVPLAEKYHVSDTLMQKFLKNELNIVLPAVHYNGNSPKENSVIIKLNSVYGMPSRAIARMLSISHQSVINRLKKNNCGIRSRQKKEAEETGDLKEAEFLKKEAAANNLEYSVLSGIISNYKHEFHIDKKYFGRGRPGISLPKKAFDVYKDPELNIDVIRLSKLFNKTYEVTRKKILEKGINIRRGHKPLDSDILQSAIEYYKNNPIVNTRKTASLFRISYDSLRKKLGSLGIIRKRCLEEKL